MVGVKMQLDLAGFEHHAAGVLLGNPMVPLPRFPHRPPDSTPGGSALASACHEMVNGELTRLQIIRDVAGDAASVGRQPAVLSWRN